MLNHFMLDIETLSNTSNSVVVSISCVQFDIDSGETGAEYEVGLKLQPQVTAGGEVNMDTIMWWMSQDDAARASLTALWPKPVKDTLMELNQWFADLVEGQEYTIKDIKLWGNGATFDNVIVRNLFRRHGVEFMVPFWCDNDVRTLVTLSGIDTRDYEFTGIKHKGIDDCKHQINYCVDAKRKLSC